MTPQELNTKTVDELSQLPDEELDELAALSKRKQRSKGLFIINVKQIPQSTVDELIECLDTAKNIHTWSGICDELSTKDKKAIEQIDKLLQELKEL